MNGLESFVHRTRIAYFTMEIALRPEMHTYSGGLGVLAGDTARTAADLDLPVAFVSLVSRAGYVRQEIGPDGTQVSLPDPWRPEDWAQPLSAMVAVTVGGREVWIRPWLYTLAGALGRVPVLLLDTDLEQNDPADRDITHRLYGGDQEYRLKQEIVLGIGGARILRALGFRIATWHLNEGHAALLTLHLLRDERHPADELRAGEPLYERADVRESCVFTTHTPVEAAFDKFPYDLVARVLGDYVEADELKALAGDSSLNMTRLALSLSGYVNGVSERHSEVVGRIFPGYRVRAITNGVHARTWVHEGLARAFAATMPHWAHEPETLASADQLSDDAVWGAHQAAKRELLALIESRSGVTMREDVPLLGFARRMTEYKRPDLLFTDLRRLQEIAARHPFQIVLAGIAHPNDGGGARAVADLHAHAAALDGKVPTVFLSGYDMRMAASLVSGADLWLNTPLPPYEASGTSGMKAALNGVLNMSVLDGWWIEAWIEGVTGWAIGGEDPSVDGHAADLYRKLDQTVLPLYYGDRQRWIWMMKQSISKIGAQFNSHRMMRRYATEAYLR